MQRSRCWHDWNSKTEVWFRQRRRGSGHGNNIFVEIKGCLTVVDANSPDGALEGVYKGAQGRGGRASRRAWAGADSLPDQVKDAYREVTSGKPAGDLPH